MTEPLNWLDHALNGWDKKGLITEAQKVRFLEAFYAGATSNFSCRLREGMQTLTLLMQLKSVWNDDMLGIVLMNEVQSQTVDGEKVSFVNNDQPLDWSNAHLWRTIQLPPLKPGKHALRLEILSAIVSKGDVVGLKRDARSDNWPPAIKKWVRTIEAEFVVYPVDTEIMTKIEDPKLSPVDQGLKVESILVRPNGKQTEVVMKIVPGKTPVAMGFDVSLSVNGKAHAFGSYWMVPVGQSTTMSSDVLKVDFEDFDAEAATADVVFSPNPKLIELKTTADQYWGKEIILSKIPLRRLDMQKSNTNSEIQPN
jgi:hypothetical protein